MKKSESIAEQAHQIVCERSEEKEREYGPFAEGIEKAARIASEVAGKEITADDVYVILVGLKLSRQSYSHKRDNLLDAVAYLTQWELELSKKDDTSK